MKIPAEVKKKKREIKEIKAGRGANISTGSLSGDKKENILNMKNALGQKEHIICVC